MHLGYLWVTANISVFDLLGKGGGVKCFSEFRKLLLWVRLVLSDGEKSSLELLVQGNAESSRRAVETWGSLLL